MPRPESTELRSEAEAAIAAASDAAELEELRVRYLGRKAELTGILRGIGQLPAEERGPVGTAGNEARQALERLLEGRRRGARGGGARARAGRRRGGRDPAGHAAGAGRLPQPADPNHARDRGRLRRPRLPGDGGPRGRARLLQLHRPQPSARAPGADGAGHLLRRPGEPGPGAADRAGSDQPGRAGRRARAAAGPGGRACCAPIPRRCR